MEAAFTENLTGRIEYLYIKLGNGFCSSQAACGVDAGPNGGAPDDTAKFSTSMVRFGIDYKFH